MKVLHCMFQIDIDKFLYLQDVSSSLKKGENKIEGIFLRRQADITVDIILTIYYKLSSKIRSVNRSILISP